MFPRLLAVFICLSLLTSLYKTHEILGRRGSLGLGQGIVD